MQLTKHGHSCVRVDEGDRSLVLDPGAFSDVDAALDGVDAVLITHEHFDHLDADRLAAALRADPRLQLFAPASVAASFAEHGEQVVTVAGGQQHEAAGFALRTFGDQHAVIHPQVPVITNVGYLVNGVVFHPGDAFTVPSEPVQTLLLPVMAPWSKLSEVVDYAVSVRAPRVLPIHDHLVIDAYLGLVGAHLDTIAGPLGVEFATFDESVTA